MDKETVDQHFITQEVHGVENKGSGNTTIDVKTPSGRLFEHVPEVFLFH